MQTRMHSVCTQPAKRAFRVRAINLELPRFAPEPLQRPLQCADGAMRKNRAQDPPNRAAQIAGIFGLLSEQPRRILHYKGIYHHLSVEVGNASKQASKCLSGRLGLGRSTQQATALPSPRRRFPGCRCRAAPEGNRRGRGQSTRRTSRKLTAPTPSGLSIAPACGHLS